MISLQTRRLLKGYNVAKSNKYNLPDFLLIFLLILGLYAFTALPYSGPLEESMAYLQISVFILFVAITLKFKSVLNLRLRFHNVVVFLWTLFFIFLFSSSFVFNFQVSSDVKSFFKIFSYFTVVYLFFFAFSKRLYVNKELFEKLINAILAIGIFIALSSLLLYFVGNPFNEKYDVTAVGFFAHPNGISHVYTIAIPLLVYKFYSKKINLLFFIVILFLMFIALLLTLSRAGFIGVFCALMILAYFRSRALFVATSVIVLILAGTILLEFFTAKGDGSNLSRLLLALTAFQMISASTQSLLWGYGVFESLKIFQLEKLFVGSVEVVVDPHNMILLMGIQFGLIVTFLYVGIIVFILSKAVFKFKRGTNIEFYRIITCFAIIVGLLIQSMLENVIVYPSYVFMALFLIFLGYLYNFCYEEPDKR